jgi:uncharacterized RDD family membrane protein YckC
MTLPQSFRGERLGLPASGPGSVAPTGPRIGAYAVDALASALVAFLFVRRSPQLWSLIPFALDYVAGILLAGRTLGMYLFGLRIIRVDATEPVGPFRAVARTALLMIFLPAIIFDRDGRGLHDRFTDTAVVRA